MVLGGSANVASQVEGDVIVVGGNLFLHPGARISGRAIAIGGGVYNSTLASVGGERLSFRQNTFDVIESPAGRQLAYRQLLDEDEPVRALSLPLAYGVRIPNYERVSGVSVPFGPRLTLDSSRFVLDATGTYRSHLGQIDPRLAAALALGRRDTVSLDVRRATLTNEVWNRSDVINSLVSIFSGGDARNYYRANRADLRLTRTWEGEAATIAPFIGAAAERAWSVRPLPGTTSVPWSIYGRRDTVWGMLRPNPRVVPGDIVSGVLGARSAWETPELTGDAFASVEVAGRAPGGRRFVQTTLDGRVTFPTFRDQSFAVYGHAVLTAGDTAPPQRFTYVGGTNTVATLDLLSQGGDEMLFVEGIYRIPVPRLAIPVLGPPTVGLRYAAAGAAPGRLPTLVQNVGVHLALSFFRFDYAIDPVSRDTRTSVALSLTP
jgi:hypothetical protein